MPDSILNKYLRGGAVQATRRAINKMRQATVAGIRRRGAAQLYRKRARNLAKQGGGVLARNLRGVSGLVTHSSYASSRPANKKVETMKLIVPNKVYVNQTPMGLVVPAGFQASLTDASLDIGILQTLNNKVPTSVTTGMPGTNRLVVKSFSKEYHITNNTNATIELEIYDICPRKDIPGAQQFSCNSQLYPVTDNPYSYWKAGVYAAEGGTPALPYPSDFLGSRPSDSQFFKDFWLVKGHRKMYLPLGSGHTHTVNLAPNWLLTEDLATSNTMTSWKGLTHWVMFTARGLPVVDTAGTTVTTSSVSLPIVSTYRANFCFVQDTRNSAYMVDSLTTPAPTDEAFINAASGQVDTLKTA